VGFVVDKVALEQVPTHSKSFGFPNQYSTVAPYLLMYNLEDEEWALLQPSSTETWSHPIATTTTTKSHLCNHLMKTGIFPDTLKW
jgi:hypothetical protein